VAGVNVAATPDPIAELNQVLSEIIDVVQEVKQAHRKVPETRDLHAEIDRLFDDLRSWAGVLMDEDRALGVSPLGMIPSVAGRYPPNLWPGAPSDEEVRRFLGQQLHRLVGHVAAALADQQDDGSRAALAEVQRGVQAHRQVLEELS